MSKKDNSTPAPKPGLPKRTAKRWGMNPDDRMRVMESTMVVPPSHWKVHFAMMMSMSVTVAIMGLSANSPAVVIGAMLIAPLMTPVLGIAASLSMSLGEAAMRTASLVLIATVGAISLSFIVAGLLPGTLLTSEVLARTAPDIRDLIVALAAGLAGSYATAKPDVSSSLPGVAIAVALVPPLAVVGITLRAGEPALAQGAFLLYMTNLAAIVMAATVVFIATGFVPVSRLTSVAPRVFAGALIAGVLVAALGYALFTNSIAVARQSESHSRVIQAVDTWLKGTFSTHEVNIENNRVRVQVTGADPKPSADLAAELTKILGTEAELEVIWIEGRTAASIEADTADQLRRSERQEAIRSAVKQWLATTPDPAAFTETLEIADDKIILSLASTTTPPPLEDLRTRLTNALGQTPAIDYTFIDKTDEVTAAARKQSEDDIRRIVQDFVAEDADLRLTSVVFDGSTVVVELEGETAPDGNELERLLADVIPESATLKAYFIKQEPVIPVPTPTATPTPVPTATAVPTPVADTDTEAESDSDNATDEGEAGDNADKPKGDR